MVDVSVDGVILSEVSPVLFTSVSKEAFCDSKLQLSFSKPPSVIRDGAATPRFPIFCVRFAVLSTEVSLLFVTVYTAFVAPRIFLNISVI